MRGERRQFRMPQGNIPRGLFRLAIGDSRGIKEFGNTTAAFSASIAPLLAFPLVGSALFAIEGHWMLAAIMLLSRISGVLLQPVIVEFSARLTGNGTTWLTTSTALNWSVWLIFPLIVAGVLLSNGLAAAGLSPILTLRATVGLIGLYLLWVQWFILRTGMRLGIWQALAILILMTLAIATVYVLPYAFHPHLLRLILKPAAS
ncbi:MAG: hypothetical protein ACYCZB_06665 [Acidiphilium sp.]